MTILGGYASTATSSNTEITFTVDSITNYVTTKTSGTFLVQTQTSGGSVIDSYQDNALTTSATTGTITGLTITPTTFSTGVKTTYTFQFSISQIILINSYIQITFPSEITIPDSSYSAGTCQTVIGLSGGISCSFTSSQVLRLTNGFNTGDFLSGTLQFTIEGIQNPRSLRPTDSFQARIYDPNGDGQYAITTGRTITMLAASDFKSISISQGSENNGAVTDYTFSITLSNTLVAGDFIRVTFPTEVGISSPTCVGNSILASSLS